MIVPAKRERMMGSKRIRVVISKVGLDGHDRGAKVVATMLREAGMEVVYLGMYQSPEGIVRAALDEDADVIGVSYLSGEHLVFTPLIVEEMRINGLDNVLFVVGGAFPPEDIPMMREMGADEVFRGGSLTRSFVDFIRQHVRR